jgi:hypothetical protein
MSDDQYGGFQLLSSGGSAVGVFTKIYALNASTITWVGSGSFASGTSIAIAATAELEGLFTSVSVASGNVLVYL